MSKQSHLSHAVAEEGGAQNTIPAELADLALIDGPSVARAGAMSYGRWLALVKEGTAPQPVIKSRRFTRWRVADIRIWLEGLGATCPDRSGVEVE